MKTPQPTLRRHQGTAYPVLLFVTLIWGATFSLTKLALNHMGVFPFLTTRFVIAFVSLAVVTACVPQARRSLTGRTIATGAILGTLLYGGYALQTLGLTSVTPEAAGFLTGLNVVMVPLLAYPILRHVPNRRNWAGAVMAAVGLALLTGIRFSDWQPGDIQVLLCSLFLALQIVVTERVARTENALTLTTVEILVLSIWCGLTCFLPGQHFTGTQHWSIPSVWLAILVCALLGTSFAYAAQTFYQQSASATATAIIFTMEPVFAAIIGWLSFHDPLGLRGQFGCLLILLSMFIADDAIRLSPGLWRSRS